MKKKAIPGGVVVVVGLVALFANGQPTTTPSATRPSIEPSSKPALRPYTGILYVPTAIITPTVRKTLATIRETLAKGALGEVALAQETILLRLEVGGMDKILDADEKWGRVAMVNGILVCEFLPDSPSKGAGITIGDIILSIDGSPVPTEKGWEAALARIRFDRETTFSIARCDGKRTTIKTIRFKVPGVDAEESRATKLLVELNVQRDPAVGRCYISSKMMVFSDEDGYATGLAIRPYISTDEKGKMLFRMRILYLGTEWLFADNLMFRVDKTETSFELPKPKHDVAKTGFVKERSDVEIREDFLAKLAASQKAYVTAQGEHDRVSYEIDSKHKAQVLALLEYAKVVRQIGPFRAKAFPPDEEPNTLSSTPSPAATRPSTPSPVAETREVESGKQLALARVYIANGMKDKAREILQTVMRDFPQTAAAKDAKTELEKLK